ncbi:MAG TPA: hypothetical protein VMT34_09735, partial [Aggregatilineales bacterium]|nr:hypothetical protein [Aggregatilineales bacterium]
LVVLLKIFPLAGEIGLIIAVYAWLRRERWLRWIVPLALAVLPASILDAAWWGQSDVLMTQFLTLALVAINRRKPGAAWAFFAIAMLTKFQSIVLFPVLVILTFRRHGWRATLSGVVVMGALMGLLLAPFLFTSGSRALYPYTGVTDEYPRATVNAFNLWYAITPHQPGVILPYPFDKVKDTLTIGPFTYKQVGLAMLGLFSLLMLITVWKQADQNREFVWAAAMYFGFFMLPTQIHERYLFPTGVFLVLALAQDRRLWFLALVTNYTLAYNIIQVMNQNWLGYFLWSRNVAMLVAWLNLPLLAQMIFFTVELPDSVRLPRWRRAIERSFLALSRIAAILLLLPIGWTLLAEALSFYPTAQWLDDHVAARSQLVSETLNVISFSHDSHEALNWTWQLTPVVETQPVGAWLGNGSHYLVVDERTSPEDFAQRVARLVEQGGTLLYQSSAIPGLSWREAVLWTFHPQVKLNITFGGELTLVGYDVLNDPGGQTSLRWYWYTRQVPSYAYNLFVHLTDPATGALTGQADGPLGQGVHPSDTWRHGEIVFEMTTLPSDTFGHTCEIPIAIGLYRLDGGARAPITDEHGAVLGDQVTLSIQQPGCAILFHAKNRS